MTQEARFSVAHLTTVDMSLRYLVAPQLAAVVEVGGESIGISSPGPFVPEIEAMGVRHEPLESSTRGISLLSDLRAAAQLWRVLRRLRPTVLHTHNPKPGVYGRVLGRLAGVPLVVNTVHGLYATPDDPLLKRILVYTLEAIASRFSDVELYQSPEDLDLARSIRLVSGPKSRLLGNGVDLSRFDPDVADPSGRRQLRAELGVEDGQVVVGVVGRLVAEKGIPELLEAAAGLDDRFVLIVIGPDDPDKPDALSRELITGAEQRGVRFLGMRTDMVELYSAMDLFVLPSHREGFPRAAMEAAAMGLPVIATDIRGCRQVVEDGVNGLLVPVRAPSRLRDAIESIGADPERRAAMGEASRKRALANFDERRVVEIVMDSYVQGLDDKGLGHLLPAAMVDGAGSITTRPASPGDAAALAHLHSDHISGFLPRLGRRFMKVLYTALIAWPDAVVLVAEDEAGPVGFISGVVDTGAFYSNFARRHGWRAGLAAFPRALSPGNLRRVWETFSYGSDAEDGVAAELLAMSVSERARRRGLGMTLGQAMLEELAGKGVDAVKVVVGSDNLAAIGAYQKMGFTPHRRIEVHSGESSEELVWRS
jgi:glycosyltransferase involved in cell wall biosynthesis/ribosomal protein S18 acetylase RimI-like enzyme